MPRKHEHKMVRLICACCGMTFSIQLDCGDRTCPICGNKRKRRIIDALWPIIKKMKDPHFLTLTVVRRYLTRQGLTLLRQSFTKLRHRKLWKGVEGGFYNIELGTLRSDGSCNIHIHIIYDGPDIDQGDISVVWHEITLDSMIVWIEQCYNAEGAMWYLTKHFCKVVEGVLTEPQIKFVNHAIKRTHLIQGFGHLHHMKMNDGPVICPECHAENSFVSEHNALFWDVVSAFDGLGYDRCPA